MQALFAAFLVFVLPLTSLGDGKVFPTALQEHVELPDQRALIEFTNGTERLVIETRFTGSGTNFAWVVPLPAEPLIEPATPGLFPTLRHLFQPAIRHNEPFHFLAGLIIIIGVLLFRISPKLCIWTLGCCLLMALLLPALSRAKARSGLSTEGLNPVSVLQSQRIGAFDVTTLRSETASALRDWLSTNGYAISANCDPVIESYVRSNWVFVAAKLLRNPEFTAVTTNLIHPLSFSFRTERAVYPTRLSAVDNGPLKVELYVFGERMAQAKHFRVLDCTQPLFPKENSVRSYGRVNIVHPLLSQWVQGAPVVTRLASTLTPAQMSQDIWIDWTTPHEKRACLFSARGAWIYAANWGSGIIAVGFVLTLFPHKPRQLLRRAIPKIGNWVAVAGASLLLVIYALLPKTEVKLVRSPVLQTRHNQYELFANFADMAKQTNFTIAQGRDLLSHSPAGSGWQEGLSTKNHILGGAIRLEDSPGNVALRETYRGFDFLAYDATGFPQVMGRFIVRPGLCTELRLGAD